MKLINAPSGIASCPSFVGVEAPFVKFQIRNTIRVLSDDVTETIVGADGVVHRYSFDWHVYLDILEGNPKILARVEVDMGPQFRRLRHYVWNRPIQLVAEFANEVDDNRPVWRCFSSRQKSWGLPRTIRFRLVGIGGEVLPIKYHVHEERNESIVGHFFEKNYQPSRSFLKPLGLPLNIGYSLTLQEAIVAGTQNILYGGQENSFLSEGKVHYGESGMLEHRAALDSFAARTPLNLYISMKIKSLNGLEAALKLCQNFIKYEQALDDLASFNRGTPTSLTKDWHSNAAKSNRDAIEGTTNKSKHDRLGACSSIREIVEKMNPDGNARYKLQLLQSKSATFSAQFLVTGMIPDGDLLEAWIRTYVLFVHNSLRLRRPKCIKRSRSLAEQREFLFAHVIRDRYVEEMLMKRAIPDAESILSFQSHMCDLDGGDDGWSLPETDVPAESLSSTSSSQPRRLPPPDGSHWSDECDSEITKCKRPRLEEKGDGAEFWIGSLSPNSLYLDKFNYSSTEPPMIAAVPSAPPSSIVTVMLRSDAADKRLTCNQLHCILKKLNASRRNRTKGLLVQELCGYFDARSVELVEYFKCEEAKRDCRIGVSRGRILGIEILLEGECNGEDANIVGSLDCDENQTTSELVTVILRGGRKKLVRPRRSVCTPGSHSISILDLDMKDLTSICCKLQLFDDNVSLQRENATSLFDSYLDSLETRQQASNGPQCRFAIAHDMCCSGKSHLGAL
jgi:hypothetical protein